MPTPPASTFPSRFTTTTIIEGSNHRFALPLLLTFVPPYRRSTPLAYACELRAIAGADDDESDAASRAFPYPALSPLPAPRQSSLPDVLPPVITPR